MTELSGNTVLRWQDRGQEIAGRMIATLALPKGGHRVVILDTAMRHWVGLYRDGRVTIQSGPHDPQDALLAACRVLSGVPDPKPVSATINTLALGLVAEIARQDGAP